MPSPPADDDSVDSAGPTLAKAASGVRSVGAETQFKAGDRVAENIELVSVLGVGGMGDVWVANHLGLETTVAVKFMSAALANDEALIERFAREAKLSSRIKSPHVVQIFDFATTAEGIPYIVMELIEGETLEARIQRESAVGLDETSRIVVQICRALGKAHEIGIIHRDMKPANVLLGKEEGDLFVRILDFGIAKHIDAPKGTTEAGTTMGTPSYMSPEQLFHPTMVDHRSDLWSLGVMTYLCLTGSLPFNGDSFGAVCVAINEAAHPLARKLNPEIPKGMDEWFSKALAPLAENRFSDAKEMSDAYLLVLEEAGQLPPWAVRKEAVEGEPPSFAGGTGGIRASLVPTRRVRGRRRRTAALIVGGAMLVAAGFFSRDASVGRFVNAHLPVRWMSLLDRYRGAPAIETAAAQTPPVAPTNAVSGVDPPRVAIVPMAEPSSPQPSLPRMPLAAPRPASFPHVQRPAPKGDTTTMPSDYSLVVPSASSENNPYSETDPPSTASTPRRRTPAPGPPPL